MNARDWLAGGAIVALIVSALAVLGIDSEWSLLACLALLAPVATLSLMDLFERLRAPFRASVVTSATLSLVPVGFAWHWVAGVVVLIVGVVLVAEVLTGLSRNPRP